MIFEIAIGVALGIILGVVVLRYWRQLVGATGALIVLIALVLVAILAWPYVKRIVPYVAGWGAAIGALVFLSKAGRRSYDWLLTTFPNFGLLVKGAPPWNGIARLPVRVPLVAVVGLLGGALIAAAFLGVAFLGTYVYEFIETRL